MKGFRLGIRVDEMPPILVAALRPGMLRLAGREGDGAIINWLSADDVKTVVPHVGEGKEIVARIFVLPTDDDEAVRFVGKRAIAAYLNVPVYAAFHALARAGARCASRCGTRGRPATGRRRPRPIPDELVDDADRPRHAGEIREHLDALRRQRRHDARARVPRRSRRGAAEALREAGAERRLARLLRVRRLA